MKTEVDYFKDVLASTTDVAIVPEREIIRNIKPEPAPAGLSPAQAAIWDIYEKSKLTALRKNSDYGSSFAEAPILAPHLPAPSAILVRMSDKVKRISALNKSGDAALVSDESLNDTINDLGCYAFLYLVAKQMEKEKQN